MNKLSVYTHLGLGDHIICKGLLNVLSESREVETYVKRQNVACAKLLFADNPRISIVEVENDLGARNTISKVPKADRLIVGHENLRRDIPFDQSFYEQVGLDAKIKWEKFSLDRDIADELMVLASVSDGSPFCFLHTNTLRGPKVAPDTPYRSVSLDKAKDGKTMIFSWISTASAAEKAYFTNSSFFHVINQLNLCVGKRVFIQSATHTKHEIPVLNGEWEIL